MSTTTIKTRILKRLAKEEDTRVLKTIDMLLRDDTKAEAERRRLIEMAVRSEEAISKADVLSLSEARKRSKDLLKDIAAGRGKARPAAARRPTARKA
ncbi:MAG: hypothetical protein ACK46G_07615 [Flavobacteriales bacterium]|jgi:hypothetical protein